MGGGTAPMATCLWWLPVYWW